MAEGKPSSRKWKLAIVAVAALSMVGGFALVTQRQSEATTSCPGTKIFEVDGTGNGNGANYAAFNRNLPPGVAAEVVVYSAAIAPISGDKLMDESIAEGEANLDRAVRGFHAACPGSKITITGYSLGAIVAGNHLEKLANSNEIPHNLVNGVLYSDARRPGAPGRGLNGGAGGVMTTIPTFFPKATMQGPRKGFGDIPVRQVCNQNDAICNSENPITNLAAFANGWAGYLQGDHGYRLNPIDDAGDGLTFINQTPRIQYGPPLPVPSPTPYELFNGDLAASQNFIRGIRDSIRTMAPPEVWRQIVATYPWIERL